MVGSMGSDAHLVVVEIPTVSKVWLIGIDSLLTAIMSSIKYTAAI